LLEQKLEEARLQEEESLKLQTKLAEAHQKMEENQRASEEARSAQSLLMEQKLEEVRLKEEEALKLQSELEEAHRKVEENQRALEEARSTQSLLLEQKLEKSRQEEKYVTRLQIEMKESQEMMDENELALEEASSGGHSLTMEQQQQETIEIDDKPIQLQTAFEEPNEEVEGVSEEAKDSNSTQLLPPEQTSEEDIEDKDQALELQTQLKIARVKAEENKEVTDEEVCVKEEEVLALHTELEETNQITEAEYVDNQASDVQAVLPEEKLLEETIQMKEMFAPQTEAEESCQKEEKDKVLSEVAEQNFEDVLVKEEQTYEKTNVDENLQEDTQAAVILHTEVTEIEGEHSLNEGRHVQSVVLEQKLDVRAKAEEKEEESVKLEEATEEALLLPLQTEVEEGHQKTEESKRSVEEISYSGERGQTSPDVSVTVQQILENKDEIAINDDVVHYNTVRRSSSSSSSSSSSGSRHSSHSDAADEPASKAKVTASVSVEQDQSSERLSEPETPAERSTYH